MKIFLKNDASIVGKKKVDCYCLDTNILQNIIFYGQQKKETHTGLEQHRGK